MQRIYPGDGDGVRRGVIHEEGTLAKTKATEVGQCGKKDDSMRRRNGE